MAGTPFVGSGWAFPVRTDRTGSIALTTSAHEIEESIHLILATSPGERPMRPQFGCAINDYVFATADATTAGEITYAVRTALNRWEPRIELNEVAVSLDRADQGMLLIDIRYTISAVNDPRNLVFPFYLIPHSTDEGVA